MKSSFLTLFPLALGITLFLLLPVTSLKLTGDSTVEKREGVPTTGVIPIIQNVGQWKAEALFQSRVEGGTLFMARNALWFTILEPNDPTLQPEIVMGLRELEPRGGVNLKISFVGANSHPTIEPFQPLTTSINYFQGDDPAYWYTNVPVWGGVRYQNLYPGIDLELTSDAGTPIHRLVVRDGPVPCLKMWR